jgi:hypothetical protein
MVTRNREGVTCHLPGLDQRIVVPALAAGADLETPSPTPRVLGHREFVMSKRHRRRKLERKSHEHRTESNSARVLA